MTELGSIDVARVHTAALGWVEIYPTSNPVSALEGENVIVFITVRNAGDVAGDIFIRFYDNDTGVLLYNEWMSWGLGHTPNPGETYDSWTPDPGVPMPARNLNVRIEVGHGTTVDETLSAAIQLAGAGVTLNYSSTPISVPLTYDSKQLASGQSAQVPAGSITISVPSEVTA